MVIIAAQAGTGTAGANQNGAHPTGPYGTPGEVLTAAGPLDINASSPQVDITDGTLYATKAYNLEVYPALRPTLIFDQLATVKATRLTHRGASVRFSFNTDIAIQTLPLLENLDVDSVALNGKGLTIGMQEYGTAVTTTGLLRGTSMVPIDPIAADNVYWNAGLSLDRLAKTALDVTTVTYDDSTTGTVTQLGSSTSYLNGLLLQTAVANAQIANVRPFSDGSYVYVASPTQAQHLKYDTSDTGWRYMVARDQGGAGNSVWMGEVGTYEGVRIIVNNNLGAQNYGYFMGAEALAKVFSSAPGYGPNPSIVVANQTDKLKRFASVGWYHLVGYGVFRPEALQRIQTTSSLKTS